jgi:hypothetical protein
LFMGGGGTCIVIRTDRGVHCSPRDTSENE